MLKEYLKNIADVIRTKLGTSDKVNAQDFPDKITEVYDNGAYTVWTHWCHDNISTYNVPYGIHTLNLGCFMYRWSLKYVNLPTTIKNIHNSVFNSCWNLQELRFPCQINYGGANLFGGCSSLHTITFADISGFRFSSGTVSDCTKLTTIIIESGMLTRDFYVQQAPISIESMKHIIEHLTDYSTDETMKHTLTVKFSDTCWSALEADSVSPNGGTWKDYVYSLGWNV